MAIQFNPNVGNAQSANLGSSATAAKQGFASVRNSIQTAAPATPATPAPVSARTWSSYITDNFVTRFVANVYNTIVGFFCSSSRSSGAQVDAMKQFTALVANKDTKDNIVKAFVALTPAQQAEVKYAVWRQTASEYHNAHTHTAAAALAAGTVDGDAIMKLDNDVQMKLLVGGMSRMAIKKELAEFKALIDATPAKSDATLADAFSLMTSAAKEKVGFEAYAAYSAGNAVDGARLYASNPRAYAAAVVNAQARVEC